VRNAGFDIADVNLGPDHNATRRICHRASDVTDILLRPNRKTGENQ
jgi:hypothetical protein